MSRLNDFFTQIDLSVMSDYITAHGTSVLYAKDDCMVRQGSLCRYVGIVKSGYFKYVVYNTKGHEVVTGFSFVGEIVTDYVRGFLFSHPCPTTIMAGCDAEVVLVPIDEVRRHVQNNNPDFVAEASSWILLEAYRRYIDILAKTPAERYNELLAHCPGAIGSLPVRELASFLGVSRRQLHRIREPENTSDTQKS